MTSGVYTFKYEYQWKTEIETAHLFQLVVSANTDLVAIGHDRHTVLEGLDDDVTAG